MPKRAPKKGCRIFTMMAQNTEAARTAPAALLRTRNTAEN
jgi:hypothetical protein